ncbi:MAG: aspartate aminotransferase family protein, partial [Myxococcota bacterium]
MRIPDSSLSADEIRARLEALREADLDWRSGRAFGYVYHVGDDIEGVARSAFSDFLFENTLDPTEFPSLLSLENQIVAMCIDHLGGDEACVGNVTAGGTESIMAAAKAARDAFARTRPGVVPQMLMPRTAHAAFAKSAHYLGFELVIVEVDAVTFRADPAAMEAAMTDRTAWMVASASGYAHGVVDPIPELGAIARARGVRLHVDACIGGFVLPFFRELGDAGPAFDLSVPGVTSISMDLHKYAFCPKGASVVLHRSAELRADQLSVVTDWSGYVLINPAVLSSRSGGPLAAAWAVLHHVGRRGYRELARGLREARDHVVAVVDETPGLRVLGRPEMCLVAITSDDPDVEILHVADLLVRRGWYVQPQLSVASSPRNLHLSLMPANVPHIDAFAADLVACTEEARSTESPTIPAPLQQALAQIDLAALD